MIVLGYHHGFSTSFRKRLLSFSWGSHWFSASFRGVYYRVACLRKGLTVLLELAEPSVDPSLLQLRRAAQRLLAREESSAGAQRMPQAKVQKFLRSGSVMPKESKWVGMHCTYGRSLKNKMMHLKIHWMWLHGMFWYVFHIWAIYHNHGGMKFPSGGLSHLGDGFPQFWWNWGCLKQ